MKEHGTHLCCSIGFLTEHQAKMLKEAGLDRINHNLNSSRSFYHNICSTHTFDQRVQNIHMLQGLGFEICSGGIIGMGESKEDVVDMLLEFSFFVKTGIYLSFIVLYSFSIPAISVFIVYSRISFPYASDDSLTG